MLTKAGRHPGKRSGLWLPCACHHCSISFNDAIGVQLASLSQPSTNQVFLAVCFLPLWRVATTEFIELAREAFQGTDGVLRDRALCGPSLVGYPPWHRSSEALARSIHCRTASTMLLVRAFRKACLCFFVHSLRSIKQAAIVEHFLPSRHDLHTAILPCFFIVPTSPKSPMTPLRDLISPKVSVLMVTCQRSMLVLFSLFLGTVSCPSWLRFVVL